MRCGEFPLVIHNDAYPYDISLVTVLPLRSFSPVTRSITNLDSILALSESWSGHDCSSYMSPSPISACVFADAYETSSSQIQSFLREHDFQQRVTVTVVYSPLYGVLFPANLLRNIAISTVFTTHFIVIDASMRPSRSSFASLSPSAPLRQAAQHPHRGALRADQPGDGARVLQRRVVARSHSHAGVPCATSSSASATTSVFRRSPS